MIKVTFFHLSTGILLLLLVLSCDLASSKEAPFVGGNCVYKKYEGTATITAMSVVEREGGEGQKAFEVKFVFISRKPIDEPFAQVEGREFELVSSDFSNFSEDFLKRHGIEAGSRLECYLNVITKGTCTPTFFEFPELKRDEYSVK